MKKQTEEKILQLLDVISVEVAANRNETTELRSELRSETTSLRTEMRAGFDRFDRGLGNLETRVESLETEVHEMKVDLRDFRGEFERRIAPLEH